MKKVSINIKKDYQSIEDGIFNYYKLLLVGLNDITLSDKELTILVHLSKENYHSSKLSTLAENVGFKHQVLKNSLTKLKKLSLINCMKNTYSIHPGLKLDTTSESIEIKCTLNVSKL
jgi:hypothetical protein